MNTVEVIVLLAIVLTVTGLILAFRGTKGGRRSDTLRSRFGPEYDRALSEHRTRRSAERDLRSREARMQDVEIHPLSPGDHDRFLMSWTDTQRRFVDDPAGAVREADRLVTQIMVARGYPSADFEQRVADVSVQHPGVVQHYRAAHHLAEESVRGQAGTEDLRQAFVHYRVLFADLLDTGAGTARPEARP